MDRQRSIKEVNRKMKSHQQETDFRYWQKQSPEERLLTLEHIRREYHSYKYESPPRFQSVFSIIKYQSDP